VKSLIGNLVASGQIRIFVRFGEGQHHSVTGEREQGCVVSRDWSEVKLSS